MSIPGRYFSERDRRFMDLINNELLKNIIQTVVVLYKISVKDTPVNIYGESDINTGKIYYPGVKVAAYVDRSELTIENIDGSGGTSKQGVIFKFTEASLKEINFYPQMGDIIEFNNRYHECDTPQQEQFLGGIASKSFSIIVNAHYSRISKLNIIGQQF